MSGSILLKVMKDVSCQEWGWVTGRIFSLCNLDVTQVAEFGSSVSVRTLGAVMGSEEVSDSNMMTNYIYKTPSNILYIDHHLVTYENDGQMLT